MIKTIKIISMFLVSILTFNSIAINVCAAGKENDNWKTEKFELASEDTIVCYYEGVAIAKKHIEPNGMINTNLIKEIESSILKGRAGASYSLPSGYNCAVIKSVIIAPRYAQDNIISYLDVSRGSQLASNIETTQTQNILALFAGFIPKIGAAITIAFTVSTLYKASVASQIRERTNYGKKVKVTESISSYGTFYGVADWFGESYSSLVPSGSEETIHSVKISR